MRLLIAEARDLVERLMLSLEFSADEAKIITDHIIGCELRGVQFGGVSRALSIAEHVREIGRPSGSIVVSQDTPISAVVEGGDHIGYLVAHRATVLAIEKAKAQGVAVVGANSTWYTGMYAHYMEMATDEGLVTMCAGSSSPRVAPYGSSEGRFGTNPIAFGFPSLDDPIILDIGTSAIMVGEAVLHARLGRPLPAGIAFDAEGRPTTDPGAALAGAFGVWGGHKGSGLAIVVQLLGILVGGGALPEDYKDCAFFILCLRPDLFMPEREFRAKVSDYADKVRTARPLDPAKPPRMPFDRSARERRARLEEGTIDVPDTLVKELRSVR